MIGEWIAVIPAILICLGVVVIPGFIVATSLGQKGFNSLALAAPISAALITLGSITAAQFGFDWSFWVLLVSAVAVAGFFLIIRFLLRNILGVSPRNVESAGLNHRNSWWVAGDGWYYAALLIAALVGSYNLSHIFSSPSNLGQTFDEIFHYNAVRYINDTGNASPFNLAYMTTGDGEPPSFYPSVWHALAAIMVSITEMSVIEIANIFSIVICSFIWPISILYLLRNSVSLSSPSVVFAAVSSLSFIAFPYVFLVWGILYPNLLGNSLIPVGLAVIVQIFRVSKIRTMGIADGLAIGLVVSLGVAFTHPNSIMSMLLLGTAIFIGYIVKSSAKFKEGLLPLKSLIIRILGVAILTYIIYFLWGVVRPDRDAANWAPEISYPQAFGEFLLNAPVRWWSAPVWDPSYQGALWVVTLLVFFGLLYSVRRITEYSWIVCMWILVAAAYVLARSLTYENGRYEWLGVWYQDPFRIIALTPIATSVLAVFGLEYILRKIRSFIDSKNIPIFNFNVLAFMLVLILSVGAQAGYIFRSSIDVVMNKSYTISDESPRLSPDELNVINYIDDNIPDDAKIVVDPNNGGAYVYALAGNPVTSAHIFNSLDAEDELLVNHFDDAASMPEVCEAIRHDNAYYALGFDMNPEGAGWYPGLANLAENQGIVEVYRSGDAALYRAEVCM